MSSNTFTWMCVGSDPQAIAALHAQMSEAMALPPEQWSPALQSIVGDWDAPQMCEVGMLGTSALRCVIDTSAHDELEAAQRQALQAAGVEYLRSQVFYGQAGEREVKYYQGKKSISAKLFPMPPLPEAERLHALLLDGNSTAFAKEVKAGANPNAIVQGVPLYVQALMVHNSMVSAIDKAPIDWSLCLPWVEEVVCAIANTEHRQAERMLREIFALPQLDVATLARNQRVLYALRYVPGALLFLLQRPGVDINARLQTEGAETMGSLWFHSVEILGKDNDVLLDALARMGARSVPPLQQSDWDRLYRMVMFYRDADTPAQLVAEGIDLNEVLQDTDVTALQYGFQGRWNSQRLALALDMIQHGAHMRAWTPPEVFQNAILAPMFHISFFSAETAQETGYETPGIEVEQDGAAILAIWRNLLEQGLHPNMSLKIHAWHIGSRKGHWEYTGGLLGLVCCVAARRYCAPCACPWLRCCWRMARRHRAMWKRRCAGLICVSMQGCEAHCACMTSRHILPPCTCCKPCSKPPMTRWMLQ